MANQRKLIGRLPVFKGEWSSLETYNKLNEVTLYGSSFRSKIDGNTYKPAELNEEGTGMTVNENWYVVANGTDAYLAGEKIASIDGNTSTYNVSRFHQHTGFWEAVEYDESGPAYLEAQEYTAGNRVNLVNYTNHTFVAMKDMTGVMPDYNNISNKFTLEEAILFVPSKYRLTGMNVGFLDSSNKPVVHKHKGGTFTEVSNWEEDVQTQLTELSSNIGGMRNETIDNEEYIRIYLDANGKFLWGIKEDGSIEWAKGIPAPIKYYLRELTKKINGNINNVNTRLQESIDIINACIKPITETFWYNENVEFINIITDSEGKILFGIMTDGKPFFPKNETYHVESNDEYLAMWLDNSNNILFGFRKDGSTFIAKSDFKNEINSIKDIINKHNISLNELEKTSSYIDENEEFLLVVLDNENKVLEGIKANGKKYFFKQELLDKLEDVEGRTEMTIDAENKILSYRSKSGIKHEKKLAINKIYDENEKEIQLAEKKDITPVSDIKISELNGVQDHSIENLLNVLEFTESFNDGEETFSPPSENISLGYRLSNPIRCSAGEWFTRNGTATALIVNTDDNDKNGERIGNPGASFQAIKDGYIRVTALNDGSIVLNRGKYVITDKGDFVTIPSLKVEKNNMTAEVSLLKSPGGKYYKISVSDEGILTAEEVDTEIIQDYDLPSDFPTYSINNIDGFTNEFDRITIAIGNYLTELKASGFCKYKYIGLNNRYGYDNFEHLVSKNGSERYGIILTGTYKGLCIFDENFNIIDRLELSLDAHDFIYIDDKHYIVYVSNRPKDVEFDTGTYSVGGARIMEYKNGEMIASFDLMDDSILKDIILNQSFGNEIHMNTLTFDKNGTDILVNLRNCDELVLIKRTVSEDGNVVYGPILGRCGGLHSNSNYNISERIKTETLCQWFHAHDAKYWGDKLIDGYYYPTYTLFDNNWRDSNNPRNNDSASLVQDTNSRIVQITIDWVGKQVKDYKVYTLKNWHYSNAMAGATMLSEGVILICWANMGVVGLYDFNQESESLEDGHLILGAKKLWEIKVENLTIYRSNCYKK